MTVSQQPPEAAGPAAAQPAAATAAASLPAARTTLAARNAWRKQQAAPLRPAAGVAAPRTPPPAGLPLLPAGPTPVSPLSQAQCLVPAPRPAAEQQPPERERCLPDAGLFGGAAFRSGWAPNGVLAHAGGRAASAAHVVVRQLSVGARVAPPGEPAGTDSAFQQRQRAALEAALALHMQHSSPDPAQLGASSDGDDAMAGSEGEGEGEGAVAAAGRAGGVPRWRLRCERGAELRELTLRYIELANAAAAEVRASCPAAGCCCSCRSLCCAAPECVCTMRPCCGCQPASPLLLRSPPCRPAARSAPCCGTRPPPGSWCTCCSAPSKARRLLGRTRRRRRWGRTTCGSTAWLPSSAAPA